MNWTTRKRNGLIYRTAIAGEFRACITSVDTHGGNNWWSIDRRGVIQYQNTALTLEAAEARILAHLDQLATAI